MDFQKEIKILLSQLKKVGFDRRQIEEKLHYSDKYLDQAISKGGNEKLLFALQELHKSVFAVAPDIASESVEPYYVKRQTLKNNSEQFQVQLVPVEAQAGYSKRYTDTQYLRKLETYPIVPGIDHHGAIWRYFQVSGESMQDFLYDGDYVLASQVPNEDWGEDFKNFMAYVIVTEDLVTIKYVAKRKNEFILIPVNEKFDQQAIPIQSVKEIWKYRRHIGWNASRPEKLKIKI